MRWPWPEPLQRRGSSAGTESFCCCGFRWPFYALSIAYGSVPIYLPVWYPFSYYNVRYGLELLPVFAVFLSVLLGLILEQLNTIGGANCDGGDLWAACGEQLYVGSIAKHRSPCGKRKSILAGRTTMERTLATSLANLPRSATLLMYGAEHPAALQLAGIPWRRVISEGEHPDWDWALLDPARYADYMVACHGDPVWAAVRPQRAELTELKSIRVPGQSRAQSTSGGSGNDGRTLAVTSPTTSRLLQSAH